MGGRKRELLDVKLAAYERLLEHLPSPPARQGRKLINDARVQLATVHFAGGSVLGLVAFLGVQVAC
jgi:hypothetical protein